jgi:hypothetical protein
LLRIWSLTFAVGVAAGGGAEQFGLEELHRALAARDLSIAFRTSITAGPPESYRVAGDLISGADARGLMYGLLEGAAQIRAQGRLRPASGRPATPIRGIRYFLHNRDLEEDWYYSRDYWREYLAMLARHRFNRFNLVFAHQTNYLAPPYPFWLRLPEFPDIRAAGLPDPAPNLDILRFISQTAADHGIDFTLGVWEHNIQTGMKPTTEGLTPENIGPYSYAALKRILAECPAIRSVQMRTNSESGIPPDRQVPFYRDWVFRAIREAGRPVILDLRAWAVAGGMAGAAKSAGVPLRVSTKYWAEDLGRPYQPAETWPGYSYLNMLEKPRGYDFYWEVWALGSHRLLLWGDPGYVRRAAPTFTVSDTVGFEIDAPLAQKGFGNRPGKWGIFTAEQSRRVFWKWEFERYWLFYLLWGRLTYDPRTPERVWLSELERRCGPAAPDVLEAYRAASGVLSEIVAAHLADPNMYIWPEINPGGLIESYREVRPSDWRFSAAFGEPPSAKQSPLQTAGILQDLALRTERAVAGARAKLGDNHREWNGSEPDFQVLALLARYHARKQMAADSLTRFYQTQDPTGLAVARRELTAALKIWERLVQLTDGLYPANMAFGPDDVGHWKDKLPYVRHDLKTIEERQALWDRFGRFDFGFDFGGPVAAARGSAYRNTPYVLGNTVEPRFRPVDPETRYSDATGYGWLHAGERTAHALPLTPYHEVRAVVPNPARLPANVLFGDWIEGRGPQVFRVRTGPGEFTVRFLGPDTARTLRTSAETLDIPFPDGDWRISGLILQSSRPPSPTPKTQHPRPAVRVAHTPPATARANQSLTLRIEAPGPVRLHYRPMNHLVRFKTLAGPPFTIPAEDVSPRWDLIYYFEGPTWFHPDPRVGTPYYVVKVQ